MLSSVERKAVNKLILALLLVSALFFMLPLTASANHCAYNTAGQDISITTSTGVVAEIFLISKASLGTARFQGRAIDYCVGENDGGRVTVEWLNEADIALNTQSADDNTHYAWTPATTY